MGEDCLFCRIVKGEIPCQKVFEDEEVLAFLDINPAGTYDGHTLLIPKKHFSNKIEEMDRETLKHYFSVLKKIVPAVRKASGTEAVNLIQNSGKEAGQIINHFHIHIIPRGEGDNISINENRRHNVEGLEEVAANVKEAIE